MPGSLPPATGQHLTLLEHVLRQLLHVVIYLLLRGLSLALCLLLAWLLATAAAVVRAGLVGCLLPTQLACVQCGGKQSSFACDGCRW